MKPIIVYKGTTGINNKVSSVRHKFDAETGITEFESSENGDIDDTGRWSTRKGKIEIDSGNYLSVFCDKGDCFAVKDRTSDSALYNVNTDYTLGSGIRSGLTKGAQCSFCQVGAKTYYMNGFQSGVIEDQLSSAWPVHTHVGTTTTREFYSAPIGTHIAYYNGHMLIVQGKVIWISEPYAVGKYNLSKMFWQFPSNIMMCKPVANGVFVSDSEKTVFIEWTGKFIDAKYDKNKALNYPAHEWSENIELVDLGQTMFKIPGLSAIWSCDAG
jgi:hypothetical protein